MLILNCLECLSSPEIFGIWCARSAMCQAAWISNSKAFNQASTPGSWHWMLRKHGNTMPLCDTPFCACTAICHGLLYLVLLSNSEIMFTHLVWGYHICTLLQIFHIKSSELACNPHVDIRLTYLKSRRLQSCFQFFVGQAPIPGSISLKRKSIRKFTKWIHEMDVLQYPKNHNMHDIMYSYSSDMNKCLMLYLYYVMCTMYD